jgi:hypothetical protein
LYVGAAYDAKEGLQPTLPQRSKRSRILFFILQSALESSARNRPLFHKPRIAELTNSGNARKKSPASFACTIEMTNVQIAAIVQSAINSTFPGKFFIFRLPHQKPSNIAHTMNDARRRFVRMIGKNCDPSAADAVELHTGAIGQVRPA